MLFPPTFLLGAADVDLSSFFDTPIPPSVDRATEDKAKARRAAIEEEEAIKQARAATAIARMEAENARKEAFADKLAASGVPPCKLPCRPKSVVSARRGASCARACVCVDPATPQATPNRIFAHTSCPLPASCPSRSMRTQVRRWPSPAATWCFRRGRPACCPQRSVHAIVMVSSSRGSVQAPS